jgi:hypothetical protein
VVGDLRQPIGRYIAPAGDVLEERRDVGGGLGAAEGNQE